MIRAAIPADDVALAAILGDWIGQTDWMPKLHSPAQHLWFIGHLRDTCDLWVCAPGDTPAGFLARDGADIRALYLAPQARRRGLGAALLAQAKTGRDHLSLWTFQANTGAIRFYTRHGFTETERTVGSLNDEQLPDLAMVWSRSTQ